MPNQAQKIAALLDTLKGIQGSEHSHPFMASLYVPLALADFGEALHRRREGGGMRSMITPALGGLALSTMLAHHAVNPLVSFMQKNKLNTARDVARMLLQKMTVTR